MEDFQRELRVVEEYLLRGTYPDGFSKADQADLRRKCRNNFKIEDGVLHYRKNGGSEREEDHWRIQSEKPIEFQTKFPAAKRQRVASCVVV